MGAILLQAIKPLLLEYVEKARAALPATFAALISWITTNLPTTIDKATALFKRLYADLTARIVAWVPTTSPWLTKVGNAAVDKIKAALAKL